MEIRNAFNVALPPDKAWRVLLDVERIAPCLPGAEITDVVDDRTYKGKVGIRLGPVGLTFAGTARLDEVNEAERTAVVHASGRDQKGRGNANAKVHFSLTPQGEGTTVEVLTDLKLAGAVAQYGRGAGMISDLATQLTDQFAENLDRHLQAEHRARTEDAAASTSAPSATAGPAPASRPLNAIPLLLKVVWNAIRRLFMRS